MDDELAAAENVTNSDSAKTAVTSSSANGRMGSSHSSQWRALKVDQTIVQHKNFTLIVNLCRGNVNGIFDCENTFQKPDADIIYLPKLQWFMVDPGMSQLQLTIKTHNEGLQ